MGNDGQFRCGHTRNAENVVIHRRLGRPDFQCCVTCIREKRKQKRANMTPEQREDRRARDRAAKALRRANRDQPPGQPGRPRKQAAPSAAEFLNTPMFPEADRGACIGSDPDIFFPDLAPYTRGSLKWQNAYERAEQVCIECPVMFQCAQWAADNEIAHGMWGGTTPLDRGFDRDGNRIRRDS